MQVKYALEAILFKFRCANCIRHTSRRMVPPRKIRPTVPLLILQAANERVVFSPCTNLMAHKFQNLGVDVQCIEHKAPPNMPLQAFIARPCRTSCLMP